MKARNLKSLNLFVLLFSFQFVSIISNGQDPHPDRGLYVDKFFKFYLGTSTVDPSNTILGNTAKENALLDYCKVNHITHLALYDVSTILSATSNTYRTQLCTFLHTARNSPYCINTIGATGGSENFFCNLFGQPNNCNPNPFAPITLNSAEQSLIASYSSDLLAALSDPTITSADPNYSYSQFMRYVWSAMGTPFSCGEHFDFMSIELEYWNSNSAATFATDFKKLMRDVNWIKQNVIIANNCSIELYLGRMTENYNNYDWYRPFEITGYIDGYTNGANCPLNTETRKVDRVLLHSYTSNPSTSYFYSQNAGLKISQIYGGGGLAGASYLNDFIELHNTTGASIVINSGNPDLPKWSVQYASATGSTWTSMQLPNITIAAGSYYLIKLGSGGSNGSALPTSNLSNTSLDIDPINGKVALVMSWNIITTSAPAITQFADLVGYGNATSYESSAAVSGGINASIIRINECQDFENNSSDFVANTPPIPHNSSSAVNVCFQGWRTDYFKDPCTDDATIIHPILSAERLDLGGDGNFTGDWIRNNAQRNIFEAERIYYQSFIGDNNHTSSENVITPGAVMWFAQSFMLNHIVNPVLFTTNSPVCASGGNGTLTFDYRGPIEQGVNYNFTLPGDGTNPTTTVSGTLTQYDGTLPGGLALNLPSCIRLTGTYTATLTVDYGCGSYTYSTPVKVVSSPTVDILSQNSTGLCEGEPVLLQASNGTSFSWIPGGATSQQITVSTNGTYTCTVTGGNCSGTASVSVNFLSNPDFNITTACPGNNLSLTITPYTTGVISWNTNESSQSIIVSSSNNYIATVTQSSGCLRQHEIPISGIPITPPTVSPAGPFTYCQGQGSNQTLQLSNVSGTYSGVTYSWLPGGQTTTSISAINPNSSTNYSIRVNKYGCYSESNPIIFTVNPLPTASFVASPICQGNALTINLTGTPNWTVVYNDAGGNHTVTNITATPYTLFNSASAGTFTLVSVSDGNGCSSVLSGQATVLPAPSISLSPNISMCSGSSVSLSASGANTYSWNPSSSISCQNVPCSLVTANPSSTTTYNVIGTSGSCTASSTVTVTVSTLPSVSIIPASPSAICLGDNLTLTASSGGTNYSWSNGVSCAACSTITVSPQTTTTYSVIKTGSNGCTNTASVIVTVNQNCCGSPASQIISVPGNLSGTYSGPSKSLSYNATVASGTVIFSGLDLSIAAGITITVNSGATLRIEAISHLHACGNMWQGIINNGGTVIVTNSIVEDAINAISSTAGAPVTITGSTFDHNYTSISLANGDYTSSSIYGNTFDNTGGAIPRPPWAGKYPFAHISLSDVSNVTIGNVSASNIFQLSLNGIYSTTSNFRSYNNTFNSIGITPSPNTIETAMAAINAFGGKTIAGQTTVYNMYVSDGQPANTNYFNSCYRGVNSNYESNVYVINNRFTKCSKGIEVNSVHKGNVSIQTNTIDKFSKGISLSDDNGNFITVQNNNLNKQLGYDASYYGTTGIEIQNYVMNGAIYNIINNWVENSRYGIHLRNLTAYMMCIPCPNQFIGLNVRSNLIEEVIPDNALTKTHLGMWLENVDGATVDANVVERFTGIPSCLNPDLMQGISATNCTRSNIKQNSIRRTGSGIRIGENCAKTNLSCNTMNACFNGVYIHGTSNKVTTQGNWTGNTGTSESWRNQWVNTISLNNDDKVTGSNLVAIPLWLFNPADGIAFDPGVIPPVVAIPQSCSLSTAMCSPAPQFDNDEERDKLFADAVYNESYYQDLDPEFLYKDKEYFYNQAKDDPTILYLGAFDDSIYQHEYDSLKLTNIGKVRDIKEDFWTDNISDAMIKLNSMVDQNVIEYNNKYTMSVFGSIYSANTLPDETTVTELTNIAYQNPFFGGEGVYFARAMLHMDVEDLIPQLRRRNPFHNVIPDARVFPNPAGEYFTFNCNLDVNKSGRLIVEDGLGEIVIDKELHSRSTIISTTKLIPGCYIYKFYSSNVPASNGKIIIIK